MRWAAVPLVTLLAMCAGCATAPTEAPANGTWMAQSGMAQTGNEKETWRSSAKSAGDEVRISLAQYIKCATAEAQRMASSAESEATPEATARAALASCSVQYSAYEGALGRTAALLHEPVDAGIARAHEANQKVLEMATRVVVDLRNGSGGPLGDVARNHI